MYNTSIHDTVEDEYISIQSNVHNERHIQTHTRTVELIIFESVVSGMTGLFNIIALVSRGFDVVSMVKPLFLCVYVCYMELDGDQDSYGQLKRHGPGRKACHTKTNRSMETSHMIDSK